MLTRLGQVELISDPAAIAELRPEWNRLLAASRSDCLFLTWEWLSTWWRHLSAGRKLALLTLRAADELVAIAPFALSPRFRYGHPLETLELLGSGYVGSDYLDVIAAPGYEDEAVTAIGNYLSCQPYAVRCSNIGPGAMTETLAAQLHRRHWSLNELQINVCPYIPLDGLTWESYLATLGAEHRYNFRRKWQRLNRDYSVRWEAVTGHEQCRAAIDRVIDLHRLRWREHGTSDAFHTPELLAFHRELAPLAFERRWLRIYTLWLNDRPAACLYGFLYGCKFYFYQSGFDPRFAKHSVGLVTMGLAIREAIAEHAREFDLLHGNEDYKSHWASSYRSLKRYELFPAHTLGRLAKTSVQLIRNARKVAPGVLTTAR